MGLAICAFVYKDDSGQDKTGLHVRVPASGFNSLKTHCRISVCTLICNANCCRAKQCLPHIVLNNVAHTTAAHSNCSSQELKPYNRVQD